MRQIVAAGILLVVLVLLVLLPRETLRQAMGSFRSGADESSGEVAELRAQPQSAQALIDAYPPPMFSQLHGPRVLVPIYAPYPFNYNDELLVGGGALEGIEVGDAALLGTDVASPGLLVGRVTAVYDTTARIQTIFDPEWRSATRVGTSSVDALLEGGLTPRLTLLPKDTSLPAGESVYNSDQQFLYGIGLGTLGPLSDAAGGAFREAPLEIPYNVNALRTVIIIPHAEHIP